MVSLSVMTLSTSKQHNYSLERYVHPEDLSSDYRWKTEDEDFIFHSKTFKSEQEAKDWLPDHHLAVSLVGLQDYWTGAKK